MNRLSIKILFFTLTCSFSSNSSEIYNIKKSINEMFNYERLYQSETYNLLYTKNDTISYIDRFSNYLTNYKDKKLLLTERLSQLCNDLYYGNNYLESNRREGRICLKLNMLSGYGKSAYYLSLIELEDNRSELSAIYLGISEGLGFINNDKKLLNSLKKLNNYNLLFLHGIKISTQLNLIKNKSPKIKTVFFNSFNNSILEPKYYDFNNNEIRTYYNLLKDGKFYKFIELKINEEINGRYIVMLSSANTGDWNELTKYCSEALEYNLKMFCLSSIYKHLKLKSAIFSYTSILYKEHMNYNKNDKLKETFFLLGVQSNNKLATTMLNELFLKNKNNIKNISTLVSFYNYGRLYEIKTDKNNN